jgi:hypothetical protein
MRWRDLTREQQRRILAILVDEHHNGMRPRRALTIEDWVMLIEAGPEARRQAKLPEPD